MRGAARRGSACESVCVRARALGWGAVGSGTPGDLWATVVAPERRGLWQCLWGVKEWQRATPRAQDRDWVRCCSQERAQRFRGWQRPACVAAAPVCRRGARGGPSGPGVSPKSLFRPHMGAGLRKWRGSQISEGQRREEEGREGWACCQPGPRLSTDPGRRRCGPPSKLSSAQTFRSPLPGLPRVGPGGPGEYRPTTERPEGGRQPWTPDSAATVRRANCEQNSADLGALLSASRLQRSSLSSAWRRQGLLGACPATPP